jgi:tripartite-type tricarboxylate transporter receptor subunit TctC
VTGKLFKNRSGIFTTHIPYRGSGPAMKGLIGGQMDVMFDNLSGTAARPIRCAPGVCGDEHGCVRAPCPICPPWPRQTHCQASRPARGSDRSPETDKATALPAVKERLLAQGAIPDGPSPAEFARQIDSEIFKWAAVVKASGARVD